MKLNQMLSCTLKLSSNGRTVQETQTENGMCGDPHTKITMRNITHIKIESHSISSISISSQKAPLFASYSIFQHSLSLSPPFSLARLNRNVCDMCRISGGIFNSCSDDRYIPILSFSFADDGRQKEKMLKMMPHSRKHQIENYLMWIVFV